MVVEEIKKILDIAFNKAGYDISCRILESNKPEISDYQCDDSFKLAKTYHTSPLVISQKVVECLLELSDFNDYFKSAEALAPGFINLTLSDKFINASLDKMSESENFGLKTDSPKTFFLDYGGPNVAKPLHVGHLRSAIVGETIKRIINYAGNKTICDVYLGDYGLQIGEVIYGLKEKNLSPADITLDLLDTLYPEMNERCKNDESLKEKCAQITKELQEGNQEYHKFWEKICELSVGDIKRIYDYLDVKFDMWEGESGAYRYLPKMFEEYLTNNKIILSEGAYIIPVNQPTDPKPLPPLIFRKSNGAYLYGSTDIATNYHRMTTYAPDKFVYIADLRQSLHYEQFFRCCDLLGITPREKLVYCGFGTVNGTDGKPYKTRAGNSPKLDYLFKEVKSILQKNRPDSFENEKDLDIIVNSVIKFADLQNNREKEYIFDIEKFSKISGKTGPYALYTYLRLNKILLNEGRGIAFSDKIENDSERDLKLTILTLGKSFNKALEEYMPSYICDFIFNLCNIANAFYEQNRINSCEDLVIKQNWLKTIDLTTRVLKDMLKLLAIDIPSVM